jgi:predicted phosphodiesterase
MKIGIYSDVHANYAALEAVLEFYSRFDDLEWFACLGDIVGYGAEPQRCCTAVREHVRYAVLGNHDAAVSGRMDYNYYYPAARNALDQHRNLIDDDNMEWLQSLPYSVRSGGVCLTHGSPINESNFDYVFTTDHAQALTENWDDLEDITLMGHSHLTKSFRLEPPGSDPQVIEIEGATLDLEKPAKYIITVGSVGQPRDNDARACCTVLDTTRRTLAYHRVDYDIYGCAESIWQADYLAPDFGKRLFLGV